MLIHRTRRELLACSGAALAGPAWGQTPADPWTRAADVARSVRAPRFPARRFAIADHGAGCLNIFTISRDCSFDGVR